MAMKYKALMLDIDGTLIPYDYAAMPSEKVIEAIKQAQEKLTVCLVTGRAFSSIKNILEKLEMKSGFAVINNGANVIDLKTLKLIYDQPINKDDVEKAMEIMHKHNIKFFAKRNMHEGIERSVSKNEKLESVYMFFAFEEYSSDQIEMVLKELSDLPTIVAHKTRHKYPDKFGLNLSHVKATKLHGVEIILKTLEINKKDVIAVGDGYNDFSLLMAAGYKVAMGNAVEDLKAIADYIAPTVEEDGVVNVINKLILR